MVAGIDTVVEDSSDAVMSRDAVLDEGIVTLAVSTSDAESVTTKLEVLDTPKVPVGVMVSVWHTQLG